MLGTDTTTAAAGNAPASFLRPAFMGGGEWGGRGAAGIPPPLPPGRF